MTDHPPVEPFPPGSRVLHIGPPKTGTTVLQAAVHAAKRELENQGVEVAGRRRHEIKAVRWATGTAGSWDRDGYPDRQWRRIAGQMRRSEARLIFFSSEVLSVARSDAAARIIEDVGGHAQVVVTLRAMADYLPSLWQQSIRNMGHRSLADWLQRRLRDTNGPALRRQRFPELVELWGSLVGEEAVTFIVLNPRDRTSLLRHTERILGLTEDTLSLPRVRNPSYTWTDAELMREFNRRYVETGGGKETWMRTVNRRAKKFISASAVVDSGARIQMPRWAVARANEMTEEWLAALQQTSSRVIGDTDDLFVDPDRYPEYSEAPRRIGVVEAARFTKQIHEAALGYAHPRADLASWSTDELEAELARRDDQEPSATVS